MLTHEISLNVKELVFFNFIGTQIPRKAFKNRVEDLKGPTILP